MLRCWFKRTERIVKLLVLRTKGDIFHISYFLFNYKARDNTNKKITIYYVVWTRLARVGCFNWMAHYKRMRIAD